MSYHYPPGCTTDDIDRLSRPSLEEYYPPEDSPAVLPCGICNRAIVASAYDKSPKHLCNTCWGEIFTLEAQISLRQTPDFGTTQLPRSIKVA
jgi:hypothetical protein